ncbi:MAG: dihydropteroate synthase [Bacillota bacterium]|nr:dihydropteroate synthase [Bacillota bacterium]
MNKANIRIVNINSWDKAVAELKKIGADEQGAKLMAAKSLHRILKLENISVKAAGILKQEILSRGGEAAVARGVVDFSVPTTDVILMGTEKQLNQLCIKLKMQHFGLKKVAEEIKEVLTNLKPSYGRILTCGNKQIELGKKTLLMGILNVTPDSFSDGGKFDNIKKAVEHAWQMVKDGADIIDIGAESTRPTAAPVSLEEELKRILPIIGALAKEIPVPISVDTYKAEVARQCLAAGAHIINDVWGAKQEPEIAAVVAEYQVPFIIMHNQQGTEYKDLMGDICSSLRESINISLTAGVKEDNIIIDPGIGFGKNYEQNLEVMHRLDELKSLGKPILLGTSRKSIIGNTLNLPVNERVEGTAATVTYGIAKGSDIVRVHDIKEMARVIKMTDAMVRR